MKTVARELERWFSNPNNNEARALPRPSPRAVWHADGFVWAFSDIGIEPADIRPDPMGGISLIYDDPRLGGARLCNILFSNERRTHMCVDGKSAPSEYVASYYVDTRLSIEEPARFLLRFLMPTDSGLDHLVNGLAEHLGWQSVDKIKFRATVESVMRRYYEKTVAHQG